jgi:uncharacterized repeat protein (TIGR01451 family)
MPTLPLVLEPGAKLNVEIAFSPVSEGSFASGISFTTNDPLTPQVTINLNGISIAPPLAADLALTQFDHPDPVIVGQPLTYTLMVSNDGPYTVTQVVLTDLLPLGVTLLSINSSQGNCTEASGKVTCVLGILARSAQATLTIVLVPNETVTITNTASVAAKEADPEPNNNSVNEKTTVTNAVTPQRIYLPLIRK